MKLTSVPQGCSHQRFHDLQPTCPGSVVLQAPKGNVTDAGDYQHCYKHPAGFRIPDDSLQVLPSVWIFKNHRDPQKKICAGNQLRMVPMSQIIKTKVITLPF